MLQSRAIFRSDFRYGYEEGKSLEKIAFVNLETLRCAFLCLFLGIFPQQSALFLLHFCSFAWKCVSFRKKGA